MYVGRSRRGRFLIAGATVVAVIVTNFGASAGALSRGNGAHNDHQLIAQAKASSTATVLKFTAKGVPDLSGTSVNLVNAAGSDHIGDTNVYSLVQVLKSWGANASMINAPNGAAQAVVSGQYDVNTGLPLAPVVDAGLTLFGPSQATTDYFLLSDPSIKSLKQLKGKKVAVSHTFTPDYVLLLAALKKAALTISDIHLVVAGDTSDAISELAAGQAQAVWGHSSDLPAAKGKYNVLASGDSVLPGAADSFLAATPSWLKTHPAIAEAVDLAWLDASKTFDNNERAWTALAVAYTQGATTNAQAKQQYTILRKLGGWPLSATAFSKNAVNTNLLIAKKLKETSGEGNRPLGKLVDLTPWTAAWAQFSAHESSY